MASKPKVRKLDKLEHPPIFPEDPNVKQRRASFPLGHVIETKSERSHPTLSSNEDSGQGCSPAPGPSEVFCEFKKPKARSNSNTSDDVFLPDERTPILTPLQLFGTGQKETNTKFLSTSQRFVDPSDEKK